MSNTMADDDQDYMTAEEESALDADLADPARIETHDRALEVIELLEYDIANIEGQLAVARLEASYAPLSVERISWVRRATYVQQIKRNKLRRVIQRDKEIRGGFRQKELSEEAARLQAETATRNASTWRYAQECGQRAPITVEIAQ